MKKLLLLFIGLLFWTGSSWGQTLSESFENQADFPPEGWEVIYGDNDPDINTVNQSGDEHYQGLFSFEFRSYATTDPYDQYLITPELLVKNGDQTFSFQYKRGLNVTETFRIGWSSTGKELSDFTWSDDVTNANNNWQRHLKTGLPVGTKYVVIHYKSVNKHNLFVDDVFGPALFPSIPPNPARYPNPGDNATEVPATASLNWQSSIIGDVTTGYKLYFGTNNPPTNIENGVDLGDISTYDPAGDLALNTKYYWRVVPYNPIGDASYCPVWRFTTMSDPTITSFPYTQDFEGAVPPAGWQEVRTPASDYGWESNNYGLSGKAARFDSYNNSSGNISRLITPPFNLSALSTAQLTFNYKNPKGGDFSVLLSTDGGLSYPYTLFTGLTGQADWTEKIADISVYVGATINIAFQGISNYGSGDAYIYLDNITIGEIPTCPAPILLTAVNILSNSADLGWTEKGTATTWEIEYKAGIDFTPGTGVAEGIEATSNPFSLTGLESSTTYYWYVKAVCGDDDDSYWVGPGSFTTEFGPKTTPYFEGFEIGNIDKEAVGNQWVQEGISGYSFWRANNTDANFNRTPRSGAWNALLQYSNKRWMFQRLSLVAGKEYTFDMYANEFSDGPEPASLTVKYGPSSSSTAMNETIVAKTSTLTNDYQLITGTFTPTETRSYSIGIFGETTNDNYNICIDDIAIYETPTCPAPLYLNETDVTLVSARLGWTERGSATSWNVVWGEAGFDFENGTVISNLSENSALLSGITANTAYEWYVQANCGEELSTWVGPKSFSTKRIAPLPYFQGFTSDLTPEGWETTDWEIGEAIYNAAIPPIDGNYIYANLSGTIEALSLTTINMGPVSSDIFLSFDYSHARYNYGNGLGSFTVSISTDYGQTYTVLETIANTNTSAWQFKTIALNGYQGKDIKIKITANRVKNFDYSYNFAIDNLSIVSCPAPSALTASNIRGNSADLGWTENGGATAWNIKYGAAGFDPDTEGTLISGVDNNPYTLSHLLRETTYDCYVQAACGGDDESVWVGPHSFTTVLTPMATPFFEGFEHGHSHAGVVANGWTQQSVYGHANWAANNKFTDHSRSPRSGSWNAYLYKNTQQWMFQKIYLEGGKNYTFDMYARRENDGISSIEVKYGSEDNELSMQHRIKVKSLDAGDYQLITGTFTPASTGIYAIGILGYVNNYTMLAIDDIAIYETPDCHAPYESFVSNVTGTTADLSWTKRGSETSWNIKYGTVGFNPANAGEGTLVSGVNTNPYTLTGLSGKTHYEYYVQAACSEDSQSEWTGPTSFTTGNEYNTIPYFENFDAETVPDLPRCMSEIDANEDGAKWKTDNYYAYSKPNAAFISYNSSMAMNDWLFTEGLMLEAGKTYELGFAYGSSENYQEKLSVYWGANASVAGMTEILFSNLETYGREWHTKAASLSPSVTGTYYIGFKGHSDADKFRLYLDDIYVVEQVANATWTGAQDNNWNNADNWSTGVPGVTTDVIIPASLANYPTISGAARCNNILLQSNASGTASLLSDTLLNVNGSATIQRYINGGGYHFVSVPISGTPTAGLFMNSYLYDYDAGSQAWTTVGEEQSTGITNDQGYMIWYTGSTTTYDFSGNLISGDFTPITPSSAAQYQYNLVPNPYPSAIDWDAAAGWTKTNLNGAIYIWSRALANEGNPNGQYASYAFGATTNTSSQFIPVGQSFFVETDGGGTPALKMNNAVRVHSNQTFLKSNQQLPDLLRIKATTENGDDEIVVRLLEDATHEFDRAYDASKLFGSETLPQLYSLTSNERMLSINSIALEDGTAVVPVGFEWSNSGEVSINFTELESFDPNIAIFLEDVFSGKMIDVREQQMYAFTHTEGNEALRFKLHFKSVVGVDEQRLSAYQIWSYDSKVYVSIPALTGEKALIQLIDVQGKVVYQGEHHLNNPEIIHVRSNQQLLIARIITGTQVYNQKVFIR